MERFERLYYEFEQNNSTLNLMGTRLGRLEKQKFKRDTVKGANDLAVRLIAKGGFPQQDRMIRDKRKSLDKATLYSYQAAWVKKHFDIDEELMDDIQIEPVRALINPDKLKPDYDNKIISVGFEHNFHSGDIFEWCNTGSYWLIYLQDLTELAYFRGEIRRCSYEISWLDEGNFKRRTYIALRGPVETKIDYIQKHQISVDNPNYSLNFMLPKNEYTLSYFKRYSKFYLQGLEYGQDNTCWRVEAIDTFSTPGIIEINAVEYYANEIEDDLQEGLVGALAIKPIDPNEDENNFQIYGDTFIRPKKEYIYYVDNDFQGNWYFIDKKLPIKYETMIDDEGRNCIKIKWDSSYSGQFDLYFKPQNDLLFDYKKTIVVESLF